MHASYRLSILLSTAFLQRSALAADPPNVASDREPIAVTRSESAPNPIPALVESRRFGPPALLLGVNVGTELQVPLATSSLNHLDLEVGYSPSARVSVWVRGSYSFASRDALGGKPEEEVLCRPSCLYTGEPAGVEGSVRKFSFGPQVRFAVTPGFWIGAGLSISWLNLSGDTLAGTSVNETFARFSGDLSMGGVHYFNSVFGLSVSASWELSNKVAYRLSASEEPLSFGPHNVIVRIGPQFRLPL